MRTGRGLMSLADGEPEEFARGFHDFAKQLGAGAIQDFEPVASAQPQDILSVVRLAASERDFTAEALVRRKVETVLLHGGASEGRLGETGRLSRR